MIREISSMAGKVWEALGKKGEVNMALLPRAVKEKSPIVYQALGWLARENKVEYRTGGGKTMVSLTGSEKSSYEQMRGVLSGAAKDVG
jgi:hypothetical protein